MAQKGRFLPAGAGYRSSGSIRRLPAILWTLAHDSMRTIERPLDAGWRSPSIAKSARAKARPSTPVQPFRLGAG